MEVPVVTRNDYQLLDVQEDGFVHLLLANGETKVDLHLPEGELGDQIKQQFEEGKDLTVSVLAAMDEEQIVAVKETPANQK